MMIFERELGKIFTKAANDYFAVFQELKPHHEMGQEMNGLF